ncbi:hypothetical protein Q4Q39_11515 [Flavivirga amylovorans]|uniref:Zinc ribbon domain-containing protein n=1 Tax=Flavivirga amylovorans TaxID=870486 RepID=A0ABT8X2E3_9FLAO|nr:hypothetical protein [Flavivirga amylovorans]MDO5988032.1 hypothetical protein [Flavivirga amylovorans]
MENKACPACKNDSDLNVNLCPKCEFPFNGTEKEKSIHIGRFIGKKGIIFDAEDSLTKSQQLLFLAAGLYLLGVIINFSVLLNDLLALIFNTVVIIVILASGVLLKKAPMLFLIIPIIVLLFVYGINYAINPDSLTRGIFFKCLILGSLIYSIYNYLASERFKKKYNF